MSTVDFLAIMFLSGLGTIIFRLLRSPHLGLSNVMTVRELGVLECDLSDLVSVTVIANKVEHPRDELRNAVERNFRRDVTYRFLVSKSKAADEVRGYYRIFEILADIARKQSLVTIQSLPYDWPTYPYVFYEVRDNDSGGTRFIAVRGTQRFEGIADYYTKLEPAFAHMIARAVLSDAPQPIIVDETQFDRSNVLPFVAER